METPWVGANVSGPVGAGEVVASASIVGVVAGAQLINMKSRRLKMQIFKKASFAMFDSFVWGLSLDRL